MYIILTHCLRVNDGQFSEETGFILRDIENEKVAENSLGNLCW